MSKENLPDRGEADQSVKIRMKIGNESWVNSRKILLTKLGCEDLKNAGKWFKNCLLKYIFLEEEVKTENWLYV